MPYLSPAQVRAARAMLQWSMLKLADKARVSVSTVKRFEDGQGAPASVGLLRDALETEGVRFLDDDGDGPGLRHEGRWIGSADDVAADARSSASS